MSKKEKFHVINVLDKTHSIIKKIDYKNNQVMKQMNFFRGPQILVLPRAPDCLKTALARLVGVLYIDSSRVKFQKD
jgi:hypothetical protein